MSEKMNSIDYAHFSGEERGPRVYWATVGVAPGQGTLVSQQEIKTVVNAYSKP